MKLLLLATALIVWAAAPALAKGGDGSSSSATAVSRSASNASNAGNYQSVTDKRHAPGFGVGGLTSGGCKAMGSWTAAVSTPFGGFGGGKTSNDELCAKALTLDMIQQAGFGRRVMQQYLINTVPGLSDAVFAKPRR